MEESGANQYCKFNPPITTVTMFTSSLYLAALLASIVASTVAGKLGRRRSMFCGVLLLCVGVITNNAATQNVALLIIGRILLGFGVAIVNQLVPGFLSKMAPSKHRGALNMIFQLTIPTVVLIANFLNYRFANITHYGWRLSLVGPTISALIILVGFVILPETPSSLIERGKLDEAKQKLKIIRGVDDVEVELQDMIVASEASKKLIHPWKTLLKTEYRPYLIFKVAMPMFHQLIEISFIMFCALILFKTIGFGDGTSLVFVVTATCAVNVAAHLVSIFSVDKWGRKSLILDGVHMILPQILLLMFIAWKFGVSRDVIELSKWNAIVIITFTYIYVAGFAFLWGPLGWLFPSEMVLPKVQSATQSINESVNVLFTFAIAQVFLPMLYALKFEC